jgi:hypothetical protein
MQYRYTVGPTGESASHLRRCRHNPKCSELYEKTNLIASDNGNPEFDGSSHTHICRLQRNQSQIRNKIRYLSDTSSTPKLRQNKMFWINFTMPTLFQVLLCMGRNLGRTSVYTHILTSRKGLWLLYLFMYFTVYSDSEFFEDVVSSRSFMYMARSRKNLWRLHSFKYFSVYTGKKFKLNDTVQQFVCMNNCGSTVFVRFVPINKLSPLFWL